MARILVLGPTGFGKTTSVGKVDEPELGIHIEGLNPETTYVLSVTSKPLPFRGSMKQYPITTDLNRLSSGRRVVSNDPEVIARVLENLVGSPIKDVVWDDSNYIMQDWYMENALKTGWDAPKKIGFFMGRIFKAIEKYEGYGKNIWVLAHPSFTENKIDGRKEVKMKTTGNMVDEYATPGGKFDIVLLGVSSYDGVNKRVIKQYITNENEQYYGVKSPIGMFNKEELYIPNDFGFISKKIEAYYTGERN